MATGQDYYCATRATVLEGTDGIIFVADSRTPLLDENRKSWNELKSFFRDKLERIVPVVICLNKRDLPDLIPESALREDLDVNPDTPMFETVATQNRNIYPAFKTVLENIFRIHKTAKISIMSQLK